MRKNIKVSVGKMKMRLMKISELLQEMYSMFPNKFASFISILKEKIRQEVSENFLIKAKFKL